MVVFSLLHLQGFWQHELHGPGEAHHRLLYRRSQAFHHSPCLQVPPLIFTHITLVLLEHRSSEDVCVFYNPPPPSQSPGSMLEGWCWPLRFLHSSTWQEGHHQEENCHQKERPQPRIQWEARQGNDWNDRGEARMLTDTPPLPLSTDLILISLWRSPTREDWTCLWRTASPSWAERGSLLARYVSSEINSIIHVKSPRKLQKHLVCDPTAAAGSGRNRPQGLRDAVVMTCVITGLLTFFCRQSPHLI